MLSSLPISPNKFSTISCLFAIFLASCETASTSVAEGPARAKSAAVTQGKKKKKKSTLVTVAAAPNQITQYQSATFVVATSRIDRQRATTIQYTMSGSAMPGQDYVIGGASGRVVIPAGTRSATVSLTALTGPTSARMVTMNLQSNAAYRLSNARAASVLISDSASATPVPSPTPRPTPAQFVWIAARTDGQPGSGTQDDPYDGSTQQKFDAVMTNLQGLTNLGINLGAGTFRTSTAKSWSVRRGWVIAGAGMDETIIQLSGSLAGMHFGVSCLTSNPSMATDNVVIHDLTCDANWDELGPTADAGAGARSFHDASIAAGSAVVISASANFSPADYSRTISGGGIPPGAIITSVQDVQHATMSINATANASAVAVTIGGEKNVKTGGVVLWGSNNLLQNVRSINAYGSAANGQEQFVMLLASPPNTEGYDNIIQSCRVERPCGNYGTPYAIAGTAHHPSVGSKVLSCYAEGRNDGLMTGFTTGGVNAAYVKDCVVDGCTFVDCLGAVYQDTGTCDGFTITNNTVIRGAIGVAFVAAGTATKQRLLITGNNIQLQNRILGGANSGVWMTYAPASTVTIANNNFTFDTSGKGLLSFWAVTVGPLTNAIVKDNVFGFAPNAYFNNGVSGTGITLLNNHMTDGSPAIGLSP